MIHVHVRSKYFCNNLSFTNLNNWYMTKIEEFVIQKVKAMRMERKWSQMELADYMNMSASFMLL